MTLDSPSSGGTTLVAQLPLTEHTALEAGFRVGASRAHKYQIVVSSSD
jgi:hypothetical protein